MDGSYQPVAFVNSIFALLTFFTNFHIWFVLLRKRCVVCYFLTTEGLHSCDTEKYVDVLVQQVKRMSLMFIVEFSQVTLRWSNSLSRSFIYYVCTFLPNPPKNHVVIQRWFTHALHSKNWFAWHTPVMTSVNNCYDVTKHMQPTFRPS